MFYIPVYNDKFVPKGFGGITIAPFIFMKKKHKNNKELLEHEKVHIKQEYKWLIIPYFFMYKLSKKWRQKWEVEAYQVSLQHGLPLDVAARWLSTKYDLDLSFKQARNLLLNK